MDHLEVLKAPGVLADADEGGRPLDPLELPVRDAHVLRALLAWAGVVPEEPGSYTCMNCGAPFEVAPSSLLEIGPFVDGELDDPELDARFAFDAWHSIPAVRVGRALARRIRLAERTVGEALPLWKASTSSVLRVTPAVVIAMGVVALDRERRATTLADALASASTEAWGAVVDLFHEASYPARLVGVHRCAACDARNDLDVPLARELSRAGSLDVERDDERDEEHDEDHDGEGGAPPPEESDAGDRDVAPASPSRARARRARRPFPSLASFEERVREAAASVYKERGVRNIDLFIDAGVPACDDGGEPLLGCYTPGTPAGADLEIARRPEVRLFYRTFRAEYRADPSFDVEHEIRETIDHEVTHHLHHLAGDDPLDDAERAEIAIEHARLVGRREAARRAARERARDFSGFLRATWPLWVALAVAVALLYGR